VVLRVTCHTDEDKSCQSPSLSSLHTSAHPESDLLLRVVGMCMFRDRDRKRLSFKIQDLTGRRHLVESQRHDREGLEE
jgi:hypothetical protein